MLRKSALKGIQTALILTLGVVGPAGAQQPKQPSASDAPWVVSVVHNVDVHKLLAKWREQQNARIGVSGSSPEMIFSITTGLVVDGQGHVVARLVNIDPDDTDLKVSVTTGGGQSLPARFIGMDMATGFAVLEVSGMKIEPPAFASVALSDRQNLVDIVSSDFEPREDTATGRISFAPAIKRIKGDAGPATVYSRARGALSLRATGLLSCNDGSVVMDATNRVLGMVQYAGYGRGYLFPIDFISGTVAKRVLERHGNVPAGWLGVKGASVTQLPATELAALGVSQKSGFFIKELSPGGPAISSGLMLNDVIVGVDGLTIVGETDLSTLVGSSPAGRTVRLRAIRNRGPIEISVILGARAYAGPDFSAIFASSPLLADQVEGTAAAQLDQIEQRLEELNVQYRNYRRDAASHERAEAIRELVMEMRQLSDKQRVLDDQLAQTRGNATQVHADFLGVTLQGVAFARGFTARSLTSQMAGHLGVRNGVWVTSVSQGSPAERGGLKAGDVITSARGRRQLATTTKLQSILAVRGKPVSLRIVRDRQPITINIAGQ